MHAAVDAPAACAVYRRRRPERTPLYQSVQGHLETYLARAREGRTDGDGVPQYVEREFRHYLECGILAHGFARARCGECGHDFLIARSYQPTHPDRDFVPWRFSDACRGSTSRGSSCRRVRKLHTSSNDLDLVIVIQLSWSQHPRCRIPRLEKALLCEEDMAS